YATITPNVQKYIIIDGVSHEETMLLDFMQKIHRRSEGKVTFLISMRTPFLSLWEKNLTEQLRFKAIYLPPISTKGMLQFFENLANSNHYNYQQNEALALYLTNLLDKDTTAPTTSTFQLLMHQLWSAAKLKNHSNPTLSVALYQEVTRQGGWEKFIQDQLYNIDQEAFERGLLYNILQDASNVYEDHSGLPISKALIATKYKYLGNKVDNLFAALISKNILSNPAINELETEADIRLSHTLLHIPLRKLIHQSAKGGQKARRLLKHHLQEGTLLNKKQLELITAFKNTLPILSAEEKALLGNSNRAIEQEKRKQHVKKNRYRLLFFTLIFFGIFFPSFYLMGFLIVLLLLY
ncbi:MAG: hypothetical protein AB8G15_20090, partial [Saprospiraceae bacterium]